MVEAPTFNRIVLGSSPRRTTYNQGMILDPAKMPANTRKHILSSDQVKKCCWGKTKCHCPSGCNCKKLLRCRRCKCS